jgi:hypothetical protein
LGKDFGEDMRVHYLCNGLNPKYQIHAGLYKSVGKTYDWMVAEFRSMAMQSERGRGSGTPQANYTEHKKKKNVKRCFKCGELGHSPTTCDVPILYDSNKQIISLCYNCREHGHMSKDCPKRKAGAGGSGGAPSSSSN